jgi:hypothetical protein
MAVKTILVIDANSVSSWDQWNKIIHSNNVDEVEMLGASFEAIIKGKELVGVIADKQGWDFIWLMPDGILIGDRNSGHAQHVQSKNVRGLLVQLKHFTDAEEVPLAGSIWEERFSSEAA